MREYKWVFFTSLSKWNGGGGNLNRIDPSFYPGKYPPPRDIKSTIQISTISLIKQLNNSKAKLKFRNKFWLCFVESKWIDIVEGGGWV